MGKQEEFLRKLISKRGRYSFQENWNDISTNEVIINFINEKGLKIDPKKHLEMDSIEAKYEEFCSLSKEKFTLNFVSSSGKKVKMVYVRKIDHNSSPMMPSIFLIEENCIHQILNLPQGSTDGTMGTLVASMFTGENGHVYRSKLRINYKYKGIVNPTIEGVSSDILIDEFGEGAEILFENSFDALGGSYFGDFRINENNSITTSVFGVFDNKINKSFIEQKEKAKESFSVTNDGNLKKDSINEITKPLVEKYLQLLEEQIINANIVR